MNALRIIAGSLILGLFFAANVSAQVRVTVPGKSFVVSEKITATVENESGETGHHLRHVGTNIEIRPDCGEHAGSLQH